MKNILKKVVVFVLLGVTTNGFSTEKPKVETLNSTKENIPKEVSVWLEKELANSSTQVLESFEVPEFFTSKNAKIIGYIKGYDQSQGSKTGMFYYQNELTNETIPTVLEIHKDGKFELELPIDYPIYSSIRIKNKFVGFYVEPGQNLSVILDNKNIESKNALDVTYKGGLKEINRAMHCYGVHSPNWKIYNNMTNTKPMDFQKMVLEIRQESLNRIKAYYKSGQVDKKTFELLENQVSLQMYSHLFEYYNYNRETNIPKGYYKFIKDIPFHKQSILVSSSFGGVVGGLEFANPLKSTINGYSYQSGYDYSYLVKYLVKNKGRFSKKDQKEIAALSFKSGGKFTESHLEKLKGFIEKHEAIYGKYIEGIKIKIKKNKEEAFKKHYKNIWKEKDSLANNLGLKEKMIYDIIKLRSFKSLLNNNSEKEEYELNKWLWNYMKQNIESPYLIMLGGELLEKSNDFSSFYKLSESDKGTQILKKIIDPYKGKVVVLSFWRPYKNYLGNKLQYDKKIRDQYRNNKDVVFLKISNKEKTSDALHEAVVKSAGFRHTVRVSQDEYNYLSQLLSLNRLTKSYVIDKQGRIVNKKNFGVYYFLERDFNIIPKDKLSTEEEEKCFKMLYN